MQHICGLDFGTSNSTIGTYKNGNAQLAPVEKTHNTIPSTIFFDDEERQISFGRAALFEYHDGAQGRMMRALKSVLGNSLIHEKTYAMGKSYSFKEIIQTFVAHIKEQAERQQGGALTHAVFGRPVFFVDNNPSADKEAENTLAKIAKKCGFAEISFQYEPVAAALNYEQSIKSEKLTLIVDIGGGTSDFSVIRVSPERAKKSDRFDDILSNTGVHIGGTDFDKYLSLHSVMPQLGYKTKMRSPLAETDTEIPIGYFHDLATWKKINFLYNKKTISEIRDIHTRSYDKSLTSRLIKTLKNQHGHRIAMGVEGAKIALTETPETQIDLSFIERGLQVISTQDDLHTALKTDTQRLETTAHEALSLAGVKPEQIDSIFLTGGSTAIPLVKNTLTGIAPQAEIISGDAFGSVGIGLTLEAARRYAF